MVGAFMKFGTTTISGRSAPYFSIQAGLWILAGSSVTTTIIGTAY
jgi:hypothetical protein